MSNYRNVIAVSTMDDVTAPLHVGCHISGFQDLSEAYDTVQKLGGDCVQVFLSPPIGKPSAARYRQYQTLRDTYQNLLRTNRLQLFVHAPYTLNLAKDVDGPEKPYWIDALVRELELASFVGARGVVLHVGKSLKLEPSRAIQNMAQAIEQVLRRSPEGPVLYLETAAGQGTELFADPQELAAFAAGIRAAFPNRVALCVDTCHVFAAGHTLQTAYLDHLHHVCPVGLMHVNDSKKPRGAKVDRHESIGKGSIPAKELETAVRWARRHNIACVLETPTLGQALIEEIQWMSRQS